MRIDQRIANGVTIKNSDTTGSTKYQDVSLFAGAEVDVGEIDVPLDSKGAGWGGGKLFMIFFDDTTTAAREDGVLKFYHVRSDGIRHKAFECRTEWAGAAGQAAVPSEWNYMARAGSPLAPAGGRLVISVVSDATDIHDSTDHTVNSVPFFVVY